MIANVIGDDEYALAVPFIALIGLRLREMGM
jgi:hypothetical protein